MAGPKNDPNNTKLLDAVQIDTNTMELTPLPKPEIDPLVLGEANAYADFLLSCSPHKLVHIGKLTPENFKELTKQALGRQDENFDLAGFLRELGWNPNQESMFEYVEGLKGAAFQYNKIMLRLVGAMPGLTAAVLGRTEAWYEPDEKGELTITNRTWDAEQLGGQAVISRSYKKAIADGRYVQQFYPSEEPFLEMNPVEAAQEFYYVVKLFSSRVDALRASTGSAYHTHFEDLNYVKCGLANTDGFQVVSMRSFVEYAKKNRQKSV